jgi:hypothetical protein
MAVMAPRPKRNEIPAATTLLPTKRDHRRHRPPGGEENHWYGVFDLARLFRRKRRAGQKPFGAFIAPGTFVTAACAAACEVRAK